MFMNYDVHLNLCMVCINPHQGVYDMLFRYKPNSMDRIFNILYPILINVTSLRLVIK